MYNYIRINNYMIYDKAEHSWMKTRVCLCDEIVYQPSEIVLLWAHRLPIYDLHGFKWLIHS